MKLINDNNGIGKIICRKNLDNCFSFYDVKKLLINNDIDYSVDNSKYEDKPTATVIYIISINEREEIHLIITETEKIGLMRNGHFCAYDKFGYKIKKFKKGEI